MKIVRRGPVNNRPPAAGLAPSARKRDYPDPYFTLTCGHYTSADVQIVYAVFKPSKDKHYCESCGKWVKAEPKPKTEPPPWEPMF